MCGIRGGSAVDLQISKAAIDLAAKTASTRFLRWERITVLTAAVWRLLLLMILGQVGKAESVLRRSKAR